MRISGSRALTPALRVALIPILAFVALAAWALSSPVGSSPDEDYHLGSIWCAQGTEAGVCEPAPSQDQRLLPEALPNVACYAFHPETSAACQARWFVHESTRLVATDRGDFHGAYPPVFYSTMNFFVGHDISRSVVAMRLANAALFVGLLTAAYWLLPRRRRTMLVAGTVVALVPLGMFLIPSVNASGWAITSAAVVFPAVVGYFETPGRRRWALAGLALLGTVVGAGARADSAVYTVLAAALATFLAFRWRTDARRLLALPLVIGVVCVGFYFSAGQSELASTGLRGSAQPGSTAVQLAWNLLNVPSLWAGAMGTSWGLGWLDTGLPAVVGVLGLAAFGALAFTGLRQPGRRKVVALLVVGFAAWAVPTAMLVQSHALVGAQVQPRYVLPLLITLSQVALFRLPATRPQISRAQLYTVAAALMVTNAVSLQTDIRRYVTGLDIFSWNLDRNREWWWAIPVTPMMVWAAGALAFGAALVFCGPALARCDEQAEAAPDAEAVRPSGTAPAIGAPPQRAAA